MQNIDPQDLQVHPGQDLASESLRELIDHYWGLFRRYYWILILTAVVGVVGAYFFTQQQPKKYIATSKLMYQQAPQNIFGRQIEKVELLDPGNTWQFEQFWNTQKQILKSRWFAKRVIERQGLMTREGFLPPVPPGMEPRTPEEEMEVAVGRVLGATTVELQPDSRVVNVAAETTDPELSALIANGVAETYVEYTKEYQSGGLKQIVNWFDTYVSGKREELGTAQTNLQQFMRDKNILSLSYEDRQKLTADSMQKVNDNLLDVRSKLHAEDALLHELNSLDAGGELRVVAELANSESLRESLKQEAELEQKLARLETLYLDQHPEVQATQKELATVQAFIDAEIARIRSAAQHRVSVLRRNEQSLQAQLAGIKKEVVELNELGVQYNQLKDKADNLEKLYDTVLTRSAELDINALYESSVVEVLEDAQEPKVPSSPVLPINLAIGLTLGLGLGLGTMVLLDSLDNTVKSTDDIGRVTDRPVLTTLPHLNTSVLKGIEQIGESPADTITHTAPKSSFAEGIKTLRANLMFMSSDNPDQLLLVTSPGPAEGKTITSVNMAIAMAQSGLKTIIIDSDMRRPRIHKALGLDNEEGLSDVIEARVDLNEAVHQTQIDNLYTLTCGTVPPNPSELLHTEEFRALVDRLRDEYDRVIFDSPPLGAVSDALILSQSVDATLLVMKFGKTRREMLVRAVEQLVGVGAPFKGCVLNEISDNAGSYGYSYYRYGYGDDGEKKSRFPRIAS